MTMFKLHVNKDFRVGIGDLSQMIGVSTRQLRYWESKGYIKSLAGGDTRKKVCKYDFVVNSRSDRKGSCGTSPFEGSVSSIYIVLEPRNISPNFANYYFRCNDWIEEFYRNGKGIVADLWTTNYATMRNIEIAIPPIKEQQKIAIYLDEKCAKIDALIGKTELKIERLKELKRSLINEVVTGQRTIKTSDL